MRLIDADLIQYEPMLSAKGNGMYEDVMVAYKSQIDGLPTIEERKKGKWEIYIISPFDGEGCRCSECGFEGAPYWDFCPNCGSYNGGGNDETD